MERSKSKDYFQCWARDVIQIVRYSFWLSKRMTISNSIEMKMYESDGEWDIDRDRLYPHESNEQKKNEKSNHTKVKKELNVTLFITYLTIVQYFLFFFFLFLFCCEHRYVGTWTTRNVWIFIFLFRTPSTLSFDSLTFLFVSVLKLREEC